MSRSEEDTMSCGRCYEKYDRDWKIPKILPCGHTFCQPCIKIFWGLAGFCYFSNEPFFSCPMCHRIVTKKDKLETNMKVIEKENEVSCGECGRAENEVDCHVCKECSLTNFNVDIDNVAAFPVNFNTDRISLCSTCAIRSHIRQNHTVVDFVPTRIKNRFEQDFKKIKFRQASMNIQNFSLETTLQSTLLMMEEIDENISFNLINLLRDAKSTNVYDKIRFCIDSEINGMASSVRRVEKIVEGLNSELQIRLMNLKKTVEKAEKSPLPNMSLLLISNEKKNDKISTNDTQSTEIANTDDSKETEEKIEESVNKENIPPQPKTSTCGILQLN